MNSRGGDNNGFPREQRIPMEPEEYDYEYDEHPDDEGGDANDAAADGDGNDDHNKEATGAEDAVLDLAELEQLQEEAERMKGLGNKHMAAQVSSIVVFVAKISLGGVSMSITILHSCSHDGVSVLSSMGIY